MVLGHYFGGREAVLGMETEALEVSIGRAPYSTS